MGTAPRTAHGTKIGVFPQKNPSPLPHASRASPGTAPAGFKSRLRQSRAFTPAAPLLVNQKANIDPRPAPLRQFSSLGKLRRGQRWMRGPGGHCRQPIPRHFGFYPPGASVAGAGRGQQHPTCAPRRIQGTPARGAGLGDTQMWLIFPQLPLLEGKSPGRAFLIKRRHIFQPEARGRTSGVFLSPRAKRKRARPRPALPALSGSATAPAPPGWVFGDVFSQKVAPEVQPSWEGGVSGSPGLPEAGALHRQLTGCW